MRQHPIWKVTYGIFTHPDQGRTPETPIELTKDSHHGSLFSLLLFEDSFLLERKGENNVFST